MEIQSFSPFHKGIADDRYAIDIGEFSIAKHFDILTHPRRLQPRRGMATHTASTGIGNLIVDANGLMYGVGIDASNPNNGKLWKLAGYGGSDNFAALGTNQLSGATVDYEFIVDWPDAGQVRTIHWASTNLLVASDPAGGSSAQTQALTFSSIGQGFVHPKDKNLYFPYRTSSTPYIGKIAPNATAFAGLNATAFQLPAQYRVFCLTNYGNYLAVPMTGFQAVSLVNSSIVGFWDRDTTNTQFTETIQWGNGALKVLNNIQGALIGISELGSDSLQAGTTQDYNSIQIKLWTGGAEPELIAELKAIHLNGASTPSVSINPRVNFINNNRLYFSVNINPNDGIQPARYGMYSIGRNKLDGRWSVNLEHMATNDNSETSVIAAAIVGDYVEMVHTAAGTLTKSTNGASSSTTYNATSVYESGVNPKMKPAHKCIEKKLGLFGARFLPLQSGESVVLEYRVDSSGAEADWVSVATASTVGQKSIDMSKAASDTEFTDGYDYEFRLKSLGGAVILDGYYGYNLNTNLLTG